ncbi:serine hydrolase domain-containing protein [Pseudomonas piscis]|uniref:Serine hydrolase domain-containing protein n=1 Tax=Pseudomonas piscis TaxID=2614538 RepID=A0ABY9NMP9_9PSED|nr:serine hydrolase domain-containing protein [Pseudomonas piscis]WMN19846.1 serine hydrolase domain-containing protein [Pseudomonas piscis]
MFSSLIANGKPATPDGPELIAPWWSFTKTVLAATVLSLVRDGLLQLDAPVPERAFTLRQLLRHEAGLADYGELAEYHAAVANNEPAWPAAEMLQRLDGARLRYAPGTHWRYSNLGYLLVGRLIERVTDLELGDAVTQRVLAPLGVTNVRFVKTAADLQATAAGNTSNYDPAWVYHGLLIGPISQAALLLDRLLCGQLFSANLLQEMQTVRTLGGPITGRPWIEAGYGLGLMQGSIEGGFLLGGHTGCGPGSVIAVYRIGDGNTSACCAAFAAGASEGTVETLVAERLIQVLRREC